MNADFEEDNDLLKSENPRTRHYKGIRSLHRNNCTCLMIWNQSLNQVDLIAEEQASGLMRKVRHLRERVSNMSESRSEELLLNKLDSGVFCQRFSSFPCL
mmetsp:Transcript_2765/g.5266  ORF Transcript_2765/g.5266 Transcript_2765/m.5266 type:complete len:100 (-) Transcript_2765:413-712(-)